MSVSETPPEKLSERELFTEYVRLLKQHETQTNGYEEIRLYERQMRLLAEIGDRLEALEASKALLSNTGPNFESNQQSID